MTGFDLSDFLPYRLAVAASRVSRDLARRYQDDFGLTIPEWRVLAHLAGTEADEISVRDIEVKANMEKSMVSRAVTRLEEAGHVAKIVNPADRRLVTVTLTSQGTALMERLIPVANAYQADLLRRLGPEAAALDAGLKALERDENGKTA